LTNVAHLLYCRKRTNKSKKNIPNTAPAGSTEFQYQHKENFVFTAVIPLPPFDVD